MRRLLFVCVLLVAAGVYLALRPPLSAWVSETPPADGAAWFRVNNW